MEKISEINVTVAGRRMPLRRVQLICEDPSLTKQSPFTKQSDIRYIIEKATKTGVLEVNSKTPKYGDFSGVTPDNYLDSLNKVTETKNRFMYLPAKTRERFQNDPAKLLSFLADASNNEEAMDLGLRPETPEYQAKKANIAIQQEGDKSSPA